jgi:hypothetical protein
MPDAVSRKSRMVVLAYAVLGSIEAPSTKDVSDSEVYAMLSREFALKAANASKIVRKRRGKGKPALIEFGKPILIEHPQPALIERELLIWVKPKDAA